MKNILVPVGSTKNAVSNLQYAIDLAKEVGAKVHVISVYPIYSKVGSLSRMNEILKQDAEDFLNNALSQVNKKGVELKIYPIHGSVVDRIMQFDKQISVDLMVLSPRSNSISEEVYLGNTSGKLLKLTNIPLLIVPEGMVFQKPKVVLMAFKNGSFKRENMLSPLEKMMERFKMELHILHVETPESTEKMLHVTKNIKSLKTTYERVENATTFQGLLENFQRFQPDIICVVRRKRGFFKKLMEKNVILKREFHTSKPLLVLQVQTQ
ncbi:MAG TPA: universal stress protein [Flavobacteriaceae bacterium]|nr:universal stress protein [Flavobacteriaceae bacterium]